MRVCSIAGCGRQQIARGFCHSHWRRWRRYGDPLGGQIIHGDVRRFIDAAVDYKSDGCLLWPYSVNRQGYGQATYNGNTYRAHNLICRLVYGDPLNPRYQASHGCGIKLCIAPRHLHWKTPKGNNADKRLHGTLSSKLTPADVLAIHASIRDMAKKYGVSVTTIKNVFMGKTWSWVEEKRRVTEPYASEALLEDVADEEEI